MKRRHRGATTEDHALALGVSPERIAMARGAIDVITESNARNTPVTVRLADWPLSRLFKAGVIDALQVSSGERYYEDWYSSGLASSGVVDPLQERVDTSRTAGGSPSRIDALSRFSAAVRAIREPTGSVQRIVDTVCLDGFAPETAEGLPRMMSNPRDRKLQARVLLGLGLDMLSSHYGLYIRPHNGLPAAKPSPDG